MRAIPAQEAESLQPDPGRGVSACSLPSAVDSGREVCGQLSVAEVREWLVTNGIGGFASGTVAGVLTRRYHGLLIAALDPPLGRTLLVSHFNESVQYQAREYALSTSRWSDGTVSPQGYRHIESFCLEGTTPVWTYACADALLEKRIWMERGANQTFVTYEMLRGSGPAEIELKALVNYRDYHGSTHGGGWKMAVEPMAHGLKVTAYKHAIPFYLLSATAAAEPAHEWYRNFDLSAERYRGLEDHEDHLHAGTFRASLSPGERLTMVLGTEAAPDLDGRPAFATRVALERSLLERWENANPNTAPEAPAWIRQLVLAADQFIVSRPLPDEPDGLSVIAGYPWFGDWGRDTMIALPGLALTTGRPEIAARILKTFAKFADGGMLPNVFPDVGRTPEYNTVDAALWYFEAVRQYVAATRDRTLLQTLFPVLQSIIDGYIRGARHGIQVDPEDGLVRAGEPGVQLTWMDAKVGDWVVTPRTGKPIEISALWLNALCTMADLAHMLGRSGAEFRRRADQTRAGFARFWNPAAQCCFDVLDGPDGNDRAIRPNQIFAVSLPESALTTEQQRAVVDVCAKRLLTSFGLRSLDQDDRQYRGSYGGPQLQRDGAYHQGTVWAWLLGPFVQAHLRVHQDAAQAAAYLRPIAHHLQTHGLGSISEIFDGDAPFTPRGCTAQAWSVAEVLRAWSLTSTAFEHPTANQNEEI